MLGSTSRNFSIAISIHYSLVIKISGNNRTFGNIAESIFIIAIQLRNASSRIDIVLDVNRDNSIKITECEGREEATGSMSVLLPVRRYNSGGDCCEVQQVKLP